MDKLNYTEVRQYLLDDFKENVIENGYTVEQAIAALLEDSILMMRADRDNYITTIFILAYLSLVNNIIPDYVYERLINISIIDLEQYTYLIQSDFVEDKDYLNTRLSMGDFTIFNDATFKSRIDMLLK